MPAPAGIPGDRTNSHSRNVSAPPLVPQVRVALSRSAPAKPRGLPDKSAGPAIRIAASATTRSSTTARSPPPARVSRGCAAVTLPVTRTALVAAVCAAGFDRPAHRTVAAATEPKCRCSETTKTDNAERHHDRGEDDGTGVGLPIPDALTPDPRFAGGNDPDRESRDRGEQEERQREFVPAWRL